MSDLRAQYKKAEQEKERLTHLRQEMMRRLVSITKQAQATLQYADKELHRLQSLPATAVTERETLLALLRCEGARNNLVLLEQLGTMEIEEALSPAAFQHFDNILARTQFIAAEFNLIRYEPILRALDSVIDSPQEQVVPPPSLKPSPGLIGRAGLPARPAVPPRPSTNTGTLVPRPERSVPPSQTPASRPPTPSRPGPVGTGPLNRGVPSYSSQRPRAGTQRLAAEQGLSQQLEAELRNAVADAENLEKLKLLRDRVREVRDALTLIRGATHGSISESLPDPLTQLRQLSGKVYMVSRAVAALGDLGKRLAFESPLADESLTRFLQSFEGKSGETPIDLSAQTTERMNLIKSLFRR